ncbi:MAG: methyltransferase domain-containing protein [Frankiales bacterium]|nr:methyltransferase domain-containing protein [Frankiales bacterium]
MNPDPTPPRDNSQVLGDTELQTVALEDNANAVNYHAWLCDLALPYLGDDPLELGSGLGGYVQTWLDAGVPRVTATEADPARLQHLRDRFDGDSRVTVREIDLEDPPEGSWSSFVSFNVMEHIPDDVAALRAAARMVRPGGAVLSYVPAFPFAMSRFDREIGHVRRYTVASARAAYLKAGLDVEVARYVNAPGLLAWFVGMRLLRMTPKDGPVLSVWDGQVIPRVRRLETRRPAPFGQSVLVVGRVPGTSA